MSSRSSADATGYASSSYAAVYSEFGKPRPLVHSGGVVLERQIPGTSHRDAMGCYPLFCCNDWHKLGQDIADLQEDLISVVLVSDPFAPVGPEYLRTIFEHVIPFKAHYIADLAEPVESFVPLSRRRHSLKALKKIQVEVVEDDQSLLEDWLSLQRELATRHNMRGMKILSRGAIERLLSVPGVVVFRARLNGITVGMHIELQQNKIVYGHLAAYSDIGRRIGVASAIHLWELQYFVGKAECIDWGGASGIVAGREDGLTAFKKDFSNAARQTYLCGQALNRSIYNALAADKGLGNSVYFPAYRCGEMA